jgi:L-fuculose-phosphate aldolase
VGGGAPRSKKCAKAAWAESSPIQTMGISEENLRADIVEVGRRLHERAYVASNDGNISVRLDGDLILTTPKSVSKGFMSPDMMVVIDMSGRKVRGQRDPSSELLMHLEVYRSRPDARAVVHAHPPVLLANHGALTVASELFAAYYKMETIEHFARISLVARLLGRERLLSREEVERLQGLRGMYGIAAPAPICADETMLPPADEATCQVIQAPSVPGGTRLVDDALGTSPKPDHPAAIRVSKESKDDEIRLTYRELTILIEEAVKALR